MPRAEIVRRIHEVTDGRVTAHDLHEQRLEFLNLPVAPAA